MWLTPEVVAKLPPQHGKTGLDDRLVCPYSVASSRLSVGKKTYL